MMKEEKWENAGRDQISLEELYDLYQDGFEFVIKNGHITSVLFQVQEGGAMYVKDSFEKNFADRSQFMSFLDEIEERADWMVCPTDSLYVTAAEMKKLLAGKPITVKNIPKKNGTGTYDAKLTLRWDGKYPAWDMSFLPSKKAASK